MRKTLSYLSLCIIMCSILTFPLFAQISDATIKVGNKISPEGYFQYQGPLFNSNGNIGLVNDHYLGEQKKLFVSSIDEEGKVVGSKTILEETSKEKKKGNVFQFNNKTYLVTHVKKEDGFEIYFQELDIKTQILGQKILIHSSKKEGFGFMTVTKVRMGEESTALYSPGYFDYSTDKTKFVFYYVEEKNYEGEKNPTVNFILFDSNLKTVWTKKAQIPYENFDNIRYTVDSKDNLYVFVKQYINGRSNIKSNAFNVKYTLLKLAAESQAFEKIAIPAQGKYLTKVNFYESKEGELYVGGFFMKQTEKWSPDGLIIFEIKNSSAAIKVNTALGTAHSEFIEKMEALRKTSGMIFNANLLEYHIKDIKKVSEKRFIVTGLGALWSGATQWSDFQFISHSSRMQDQNTGGTGFEDDFPIVILTDSNKLVWGHIFDNNFAYNTAVNRSFSGFLIDKNNSVFFFNEAVSKSSGDSKNKQDFEFDIKKINIEGIIESQKVGEKSTFLSAPFANVKSIIRKDSNHFLVAISIAKGGKNFYKIINVETK